MNNIKVIATWHIIIDKDFSKEREINGIISFPAIVKVFIHIPQFRYIKYSGMGLSSYATSFHINEKTFGLSITNIDKLNEILNNELDKLNTDFHLNIDKALNYNRIKNLYIERYLRGGKRIDIKFDEEIGITKEYINKIKGEFYAN